MRVVLISVFFIVLLCESALSIDPLKCIDLGDRLERCENSEVVCYVVRGEYGFRKGISCNFTKKTDETALGDQRLPWYSSASGKFEYGTRWDDLKAPASAQRQGQGSKPDFDFANIGWLFPDSVTTEFTVMNFQIGHGWKIGSDIHPHVHFRQSVAALPTFKMDYRWYSIGDTIPAVATVSTTTTPSVTFAVNQHQRLPFTPISGAAITGLSSMLDIKLYRDDTAVTGDVLLWEFDIHIEMDSLGSENEDTKT